MRRSALPSPTSFRQRLLGQPAIWFTTLFLTLNGHFGSHALPLRASITVPSITASPLQSAAPELRGTVPDEIRELKQAAEAFDKQDFDACMKLLTAAHEQHSYLPPPSLMLARFFLSTDQSAAGRIALEQAAVQDPTYPGLYLTFGKLALSDGRTTDAMLHFYRALALLNRGTWQENQRLGFSVETHAGLAAVAEARNQWDKAKEQLEKWLVIDARNVTARRRLAKALFFLNQLGKAREQLEQARAVDPNYEPVDATLAWLFAQQGNNQKASELMTSVVRQAPKDSTAHLARGTWLMQQGELDTALRHAKFATQLDPSSIDAKLLQGLIARQLKDFREVERCFEELLHQSPENSTYQNQLALALVEQADESKRRRALELAESNARLYPDSPEALSTLGWVYFRINRMDDAERTLKAANAKAPTRSDPAYYLARLLMARGAFDAAEDLLRRALAAPGQFLARDEARAILKQVVNRKR